MKEIDLIIRNSISRCLHSNRSYHRFSPRTGLSL